jgi:ABC-type phosphate transport system substrate-binding protein
MRHFVSSIVAIAIIASWSKSAVADPPPRAIVVVVAKGSKITRMSKAELKRCFSGDAVVIAGQRLSPFNYPPGSAERKAFDRAILGKSSEEVGRYWVDRKIRGESPAPRTLPSPSHVAKIVAKFPSAIGYLPADQLTTEVVAIAIDDLQPITVK